MNHPYRIRDIAARAGVSVATVDRVLHDRGGVRESTARRVRHAAEELCRPEPPACTVDVVGPAGPALRAALRAELPGLRPAGVRPRFHTAGDPHRLAVTLRRLGGGPGRLGGGPGRGVILLGVPDVPEVVEAVGRLDVPVVTLGADLPASKRVAHVGPDEAAAGATAAYLVEQWLADRAGDVLLVHGGDGDGDGDRRVRAFRAEMRARAPHRRLLDQPGAPAGPVAPSVRAVYSVLPGANAAVLAAFAAAGRNYDVFVAHELTAGNAALLREYRISAVLHDDLRAAVRQACLAILQAQGVLPGPVRCEPVPVQVLTPVNLPAA